MSMFNVRTLLGSRVLQTLVWPASATSGAARAAAGP